MRGCAWPVAQLGAVSLHCAPEAAACPAASGIARHRIWPGAGSAVTARFPQPRPARLPAGLVRLPMRMR
jgi:hypothetical protein